MHDEFLSWMLQSLSSFVGPVESRKAVGDRRCGDEIASSAREYLQALRHDWEPRLYILNEIVESQDATVGYGCASVAVLGLLLADAMRRATAQHHHHLTPLDITDELDSLLDTAEHRFARLAPHAFTPPDSLNTRLHGTPHTDDPLAPHPPHAPRRSAKAQHTIPPCLDTNPALWRLLLGQPASGSPLAAQAVAAVAALPAASAAGACVRSPSEHIPSYGRGMVLPVEGAAVLELRRPDAAPLSERPPVFPAFCEAKKCLLVRTLRGRTTTTQGGKLRTEGVAESPAELSGLQPLLQALESVCRQESIACVVVGAIDNDAWGVWEHLVSLGILLLAEVPEDDMQGLCAQAGPGVSPCEWEPRGGVWCDPASGWAPHCCSLQLSTLCPAAPGIVAARVAGPLRGPATIFVADAVTEWQNTLLRTARSALRRRAAISSEAVEAGEGGAGAGGGKGGGVAAGLLPGGGFLECCIASLAQTAGEREEKPAKPEEAEADGVVEEVEDEEEGAGPREGCGGCAAPWGAGGGARGAACRVLSESLCEYLRVAVANTGVLRGEAVEVVAAGVRGAARWLGDCDAEAMRAVAGAAAQAPGGHSVENGYPVPPILRALSGVEADLPIEAVTHWEPFQARMGVLRHAVLLAQTLATVSVP